MTCRAPPFFALTSSKRKRGLRLPGKVVDRASRYTGIGRPHQIPGNHSMRYRTLTTALTLLALMTPRAIADEPGKKDSAPRSSDELIKKLEDDLTNVKLL